MEYFPGLPMNMFVPETSTSLANKLRKFPKNTQDSREFILGTFDPKCAADGAKLLFHRTDRKGHAVLESTIQLVPEANSIQSASQNLPIEAANTDTFVTQLESLKLEIGETAFLQAAA
jgi:hypothetical protein